MTDEEASILNKLRARLTPAEIREMANAGYTLHGYSTMAIASRSGELRRFNANPGFVPGLAWLHRSNDLAGSMFSDYALSGNLKEVKILDLGGGTGGTTESIVHHLAERLPKGTRVRITTMEQNESQLAALRAKVKTLQETYGSKLKLTIKVAKGNMLDTLAELKSGQYHGAVAAYSTHHIHEDEKQQVASHIHRLLAPGAAYVINDCNGRSDINKTYFNWLLGHYSVFNEPEETAEKLEKAGFEAHRTDSQLVKQAARRAIPHSNKRINEMKADEAQSKGYYVVGIKPEKAANA